MTDDHENRLLAAEQEVQKKLGDRPFDFTAMRAISNIYRAAAAVRRQAEREVLADHNLSWGGFTILWVLWVWGAMETGRLAAECDLAKGTLTGMVTTLENQNLVTRKRVAADRRRVEVGLTPKGGRLISRVFPTFNRFESAMVDGLSPSDQAELARLLRLVVTNANPDSDAEA